jgi:hypothetical protein
VDFSGGRAHLEQPIDARSTKSPAKPADTMAPSSSTSIARKARSKAEADFATWLMMAKLGSFDDLPAIAQGVLNNYRERLDRMGEIESKALAVSEIYAAYYSEMGGSGTAPEPEPRPKPKPDPNNVVKFERARDVRVPHAASAGSKPAKTRKSVPAILIFAAMVAAIAAFKFLVG